MERPALIPAPSLRGSCPPARPGYLHSAIHSSAQSVLPSLSDPGYRLSWLWGLRCHLLSEAQAALSCCSLRSLRAQVLHCVPYGRHLAAPPARAPGSLPPSSQDSRVVYLSAVSPPFPPPWPPWHPALNSPSWFLSPPSRRSGSSASKSALSRDPKRPHTDSGPGLPHKQVIWLWVELF